jgi:hypothetical protein
MEQQATQQTFFATWHFHLIKPLPELYMNTTVAIMDSSSEGKGAFKMEYVYLYIYMYVYIIPNQKMSPSDQNVSEVGVGEDAHQSSKIQQHHATIP